MILGESTIKGYRNAAKQLRYMSGIEDLGDRVENCLGLVRVLSKSAVSEYDGLVMPLKRGQPLQLLASLAAKSSLNLIVPVCPPAPLNARTYKPGITPEAVAGIRAANILAGSFAEVTGADVEPVVLVADTENDLEAVMERAGGSENYLAVCDESAELIATQLGNGVKADTFSRYFGERVAQIGGFHALQYAAERAIREAMSDDGSFSSMIAGISSQRAEKHALILGRPEQGNELAVRYAAQYTALGDYVREANEVDAVCNYPTPNSNFYNAPDKTSVAVFESRVER